MGIRAGIEKRYYVYGICGVYIPYNKVLYRVVTFWDIYESIIKYEVI